MAAADPTTGVATPRGVLQGVAVFGWDGTAWQPAGRAGPSVATPTGVLQGVAPFVWYNNGWRPSGIAPQPGVATPSGVLDGVAVYTWDGSAWTPLATPAGTPSGTLRGVAAFSWDGSAWQPAAQAGPSVATPYGVLDGVALFNWTGSAWAAGAPAPTLALDFTVPGSLPANVTFTRSTTATYFNSAGTMQTAAINAPRWDYDPVTRALLGLLIEEARTNLLLNSAALSTQSVTVAATAYTLSFYGTGTVTLSGASTAGPLVGTGASPQRVALTFTPAAGTLTCTVSGSVVNAQLEAGVFPTSYIPTTAVAVARGAEVCTMPTAGWFASPPAGGTLMGEALHSLPRTVPITQKMVTLGKLGANTDRIELYIHSNNTVRMAIVANNVGSVSVGTVPEPVGSPYKAAIAFATGAATLAVNGSIVAYSYAAVLPTNVDGLAVGVQLTGATTQQFGGHIRRVSYWSRALTVGELQAVTSI